MKTQRKTEPISLPAAAKLLARVSIVTWAAISAGRLPITIAPKAATMRAPPSERKKFKVPVAVPI